MRTCVRAMRILRQSPATVGLPGQGREEPNRCDECRTAIERDDREALLERAAPIPLPRTVPDRYAPRFREVAKQLHTEFWEARAGELEPLSPV
jgi:hypothetical protein